jgi:Leucine-rich repeat (LRR) protein
MKKLLVIFLLTFSIAATAQMTYVPDDNFEKVLINMGYDGPDLNDSVPTNKIAKIKNLDVNSKNISDLTGIEDFISLELLDCSLNEITKLNLSKNTKLKELRCRNNDIKSLILGKNPNLIYMECYANQITSMDLSNLQGLQTLNCSVNQLSDLDISKNQDLIILYCESNLLESLDISNNPDLITLECYSNQLKSLDLVKNSALEILNCAGNKLESLNLTKNSALKILHCSGNKLVNLDLTKNSALESLGCAYAELTSLDISKNHALKSLWCRNNLLTSLDLSNNPVLEEFNAWLNPFLYCIQVIDSAAAEKIFYKDKWAFFSEDCSGFKPPEATYVPDDNFEKRLIELSYDAGPLNDTVPTLPIACVETLFVSQRNVYDLTGIEAFNALKVLICNDNKLTRLDLSKNTKLWEVECSYNDLISLNISNNPSLIRLECYSNMLTSLDLSSNIKLKYMKCFSNHLTSLDLSKNINLLQLDCTYNRLRSLDVSKNINIGELYCYKNQLMSMKVNNAELTGNLRSLYCSSNLLTSLEVNMNHNLRSLDCSNNLLMNLDVSHNPDLEILYTKNNPNLYCIQVIDYNLIYFIRSCDLWTNFSIDCGYSNVKQYTYIPDDNFEQHLINNGLDSSKLDDIVLTKNIDTIKSLRLQMSNITDLTGIEDFSSLEKLWCYSNNLKKLDLSNNIALKDLDCRNNKLTSLDISKNTAIVDLDATNNLSLSCILVNDSSLASQNQNWYKDDWANYSEDCGIVGLNKKTYILDDNFEQVLINRGYDSGPPDDSVSTKNIAKCIDLDVGNCNISDLTGIEDFIALETLRCYSNNLTSLDVGKNTKMNRLDCSSNRISSLDISKNKALKYLICYDNQLTELDISKNLDLGLLLCYSNQIDSLNLGYNLSLKYLNCSENKIRGLDVWNTPALKDLICYSNQITSLNINRCYQLERLLCSENHLMSLNIKNNTALGYFDAVNNPNLSCIQVIDPYAAEDSLGWLKDISAIYSLDCSTVSVDEGIDVRDDVSLSPNPASDYIEISIQGEHIGSPLRDIKIYNTMGECVFTLTPALSQREKELKVDVTGLAAGVYFVRIGDRVSKFIKAL